MTREAAALLSDALHLPPEERRQLANELWASLGDDPSVLEAWLDAAEDRAAEVDRGDVEPVAWEDARKQIFRRDES